MLVIFHPAPCPCPKALRAWPVRVRCSCRNASRACKRTKMKIFDHCSFSHREGVVSQTPARRKSGAAASHPERICARASTRRQCRDCSTGSSARLPAHHNRPHYRGRQRCSTAQGIREQIRAVRRTSDCFGQIVHRLPGRRRSASYDCERHQGPCHLPHAQTYGVPHQSISAPRPAAIPQESCGRPGRNPNEGSKS